MAFQNPQVGVQFPDYLKNPGAGQQQTQGGGNPNSFADQNRKSLADSLGASGIVGQDGRLDMGKTMGALKGFCV